MMRKVMLLVLLMLAANLAFADSSDKLAEKVDELIQGGQIEQAERQVDSALAITPDDYKLLTAKGNVIAATGDYADALKYYEQALSQKSKDPNALYGAGMAALRTDDPEKALDYFKRGEKTKKRKSDFLYGKAMAEKELGELKEADATIRKAISKDKDNPTLHRALGDINFEKNVWSIAISEYKKALELDSTETDLYYKIARANFFSQNFTDAVKYYKDYLKIFEDDTTAWVELAKICVAANNAPEAIFCYTKLTQLEPENGEYWYTLGDLQFGINDFEDAGKSLEKAVELKYDVAEAYKSLAKIYQIEKKYFKADSAYTRYEQELGPPDDPEYWFDKGKVMLKIGQTDATFFNQAITAFDKAISLDSSNATYWEYGGLARYYKQDFRGAIPFFIKRIELGEENVNALRNLAFCYLKTEQYNKAASTLEKAIELKPDDAVMRKMIGKIYIFLAGSNPSELDAIIPKAIPHLKAALRDTTNALSSAEKCEVRGDLGYCYVALRDPTNAIPYLEASVKCDPKNVDYLFNLATAYFLNNQVELANEYAKKVLDINPSHKGADELEKRTRIRK
jgi:tetratricopeptide (TPR) repeat protein